MIRPLLDQSPDVFFWQDLQGIIRDCNKSAVKTLGFRSHDEMIGTTPYDFKCPAAQNAENFNLIDLEVLTKQTTITSIVADHYAYGFDICLVTKIPIIEQGKLVGLLTQGQQINTKYALGTVGLHLSNKYQEKYGCKQRVYTLSKKDLQFSLSIKEEECLFYLLCGKTMEETAKILSRSCRTIETHLRNIRKKMRCKSRSEVIEKAIVHGYMNRMPRSVISKKCIVVL